MTIIRKAGIVVDPAVSDLDFTEVLDITEIAPGVIQIAVIDGSILTAMIGDDQITNAKIAPGAIGTNELINLNVTTAKLADGAATPVKQVGVDALLATQSATATNAAGIAGTFQYLTPSTTLVIPNDVFYDIYATADVLSQNSVVALTSFRLDLSDGTTTVNHTVARSPSSATLMTFGLATMMNSKKNVTMTATLWGTNVAGNTLTTFGANVSIRAIPRI